MEDKKDTLQKVNNFFLWVSVTDPDIINRPECLKREKIIQSIKGQIIFVVSLFAMISGAYAVYIISQSGIISILIGLLWGYFIFSVDRLLSAPFKKWNYVEGWDGTIHNFIKPILIRLPLASLLGILIAIPILLKIFNPEIKEHWIEKKSKGRIQEDKLIKNDLEKKKEMLQLNYDNAKTEYAELSNLVNGMPKLIIKDSIRFQEFMDAKLLNQQREQLRKISEQKDELNKKLSAAIDSIYAFTPKSEKEKRGQLGIEFDNEVSLGIRFENLKDVLDSPTHKNLWWIHFWLQTVIILIELMPVLMKVFSDISNYDLLIEENFHETIERIHGKAGKSH